MMRGENSKTESMKRIHRIDRWGGLMAAITVICAVSIGTVQAGDTKPFKEIGLTPVASYVNPGSFKEQIFVDARARHGAGNEFFAAVVLHISHNNVGGRGSGFALEAGFADSSIPAGAVVYLVVYEVMANGDQLVLAGTAIPQLEGGYVVDLRLVPSQGTGRFAGATGGIDQAEVTYDPAGYIFEGRISTVGKTKK
jgi:hypothetical protein